jgi:hypothetical protein
MGRAGWWRGVVGLLVVGAATTATGCGGDDQTLADPLEGERRFEVTVENQTDGQPFSPGVAIVHTIGAPPIRLGAAASDGLRRLAEEGDPSLLVEELADTPGVLEAILLEEPLQRRGIFGRARTTFEVSASAATDQLTIVMQLACTNDGLAAALDLDFPVDNAAQQATLVPLDAGTEVNDELYLDLNDFCQEVGPLAVPLDGNAPNPEVGVLETHPGILGIGELEPARYGFPATVGQVRLQLLQ